METKPSKLSLVHNSSFVDDDKKSFLFSNASFDQLGFSNVNNDAKDKEKTLFNDASISIIESYKTLPQAFLDGQSVKTIIEESPYNE
jgi:hypothetical protein